MNTKIKKNKMALLGFLGLLGLLGIPTQHYALFGFFGFFGFFALFTVKNDELLKENIRRASTNGFVVSLIGLSITMALVAIFESIDTTMIGIAVTFVAQILTYSFSIGFYERR
ncbi:MAG: DUF3796 domain-containing protein [Candidatus Woesearchaeota archaeon]